MNNLIYFKGRDHPASLRRVGGRERGKILNHNAQPGMIIYVSTTDFKALNPTPLLSIRTTVETVEGDLDDPSTWPIERKSYELSLHSVMPIEW